MFQKPNELEEKLLKCIVKTLIFLEFSDEDTVNADAAIELMEDISHTLRELGNEDKRIIKSALNQLGSQYTEAGLKDFLLGVSDNLGID